LFLGENSKPPTQAIAVTMQILSQIGFRAFCVQVKQIEFVSAAFFRFVIFVGSSLITFYKHSMFVITWQMLVAFTYKMC